MKIYNVGIDPLGEYNLKYLNKETYEYIIYNYEAGDCDGSGAAVLKDKNGKFMLLDLGHCSCHGPLEERSPKCIYSLEEIITLLNRRCQNMWQEYVKDVARKFKELERLDYESR